MSSPLDIWIHAIRSFDASTFEDAYFGTRPEGPEVQARLIAELLASEDAFTRGKFCELLGEMGDTSAIPVLQAELSHPESSVRDWAQCALETLNAGPDRRDESAAWRSLFRTKPDQS